MPEFRSITGFTSIHAHDYAGDLDRIGAFLNIASTAFEDAGISVQSKRLGTQPFSQFGVSPADLPETVKSIRVHANHVGIDYLSIGAVGIQDDPGFIDALADVFSASAFTFGSVKIAEREHGGIHLPLLRRMATLIDRVSRITSDGFSNLFLAGLANCPPHSPFFPVAYHDGGEPAFALAIQAADLPNTVFANVTDPTDAKNLLTDAINHYTAQIIPTAEGLAREYAMRFVGIDFSLAPYPVDEKSLGGAMEKLGPAFGGFGLIAAASIIMNAVEAADFPSAGFSGLMLPVLEDNILGERVSEGRLTINDLLLLSTICGTGLDCIPLAGDIGTENLYAILLDVAALALRLDKPLTARLMPFPGKKPGDKLSFDFEYFGDSRVMPTPAYVIRKDAALGSEQGQLDISPRRRS